MTKPLDNPVLRTMIGHPKFADYSAALIEETYDIMLRLAPTLASIAPIAGHWVRQMMHQGFVGMEDVKKLCDAEDSANQANQVEHMRDMSEEAFEAGVRWHRDGPASCTIDEAFECWWQNGDQV